MRSRIWFHRSSRFRKLPARAAGGAVVVLALAAGLWSFAGTEGDAGPVDASAGEGRMTVSQLQRPAAPPLRHAADGMGRIRAASLDDGVAAPVAAAGTAGAGVAPAVMPGRAGPTAHGAPRGVMSAPLRNERAADEPEEAPRWTPQLSDTWHMQLMGEIRQQGDAQIYVVDLFDFPQARLEELHRAGKRVVCLFSAGSAESWRPDHARFLPHEMGAPVAQGPDERWVDTRSANVRAVMTTRLDHAAARGCDAVALGAVDGYSNNAGLALNAVTQLEFNRFMAKQARSKGLAVGLVNDVEQVVQLAGHFDFAINAQCHEYDECLGYQAFVAAKKPVFNVEYDGRYVVDAAARADLCAQARSAQLRTLVLPQSLDGSYRFSCDSGGQ